MNNGAAGRKNAWVVTANRPDPGRVFQLDRTKIFAVAVTEQSEKRLHFHSPSYAEAQADINRKLTIRQILIARKLRPFKCER
ncbi:hypothetical protein [Sphingomonas lacusdianchii]|uniref:hypothetical protein n=1 Tax=Sphingomonas lacusdianchii TaxID=2917992 RepID=UPI001F59BEDC|nr:hypothetical protein [Sphingomonas sp. JXJ CY 53]